MRLLIVSHKLCWPDPASASGFSTDGGFPLQIATLSELFAETRVAVPCEGSPGEDGLSPLVGESLSAVPLKPLRGKGFARKLYVPFWLLRSGLAILKEARMADAVHAPIPGDVGTVGILAALILRKPLLVRHCGNWFVQRTTAERFWKWLMEKFAGGRNVMFATGGADEPPSSRNPDISWIFSTSLRKADLDKRTARSLPVDGRFRLITVCRLEERKGVDVVLRSLPKLREELGDVSLDIVGGGSLREKLENEARELGVAEYVTFHGKVRQSRVAELLSGAHVFCFPTTASEGFPKVVIEALSCGLPVVTTKVSVLPSLVGKGGGILIDAATAEEVVNAVREILRDGKRFDELSLKAIATARDYSLEAWRDEIGRKLREAWKVELTGAGDLVAEKLGE